MRGIACAVTAFLASGLAPALAQESCATPNAPLKPVIATHTIPPYPEMSVMTGEQGTVLLLVHIGVDGIVDQAQVSQSSGSLRLDEAARDYVKENWRWQPPTRDCMPIAVSTRVSVKWDLEDAQEAGPRPPTITVTAADYPAEALARREQGTVSIFMVITPEGTIGIANVAYSSGFPDLDAKALEIAKTRAHWTPAMMNGGPVATPMFVLVRWDLDKLGSIPAH